MNHKKDKWKKKEGDIKENSIFSQLKRIQFNSNFLKYM